MPALPATEPLERIAARWQTVSEIQETATAQLPEDDPLHAQRRQYRTTWFALTPVRACILDYLTAHPHQEDRAMAIHILYNLARDLNARAAKPKLGANKRAALQEETRRPK